LIFFQIKAVFLLFILDFKKTQGSEGLSFLNQGRIFI